MMTVKAEIWAVSAEVPGSARNADGEYQNPPGSPQRTAGRWDFFTFMLDGVFAREKNPKVPAGYVLDAAAADRNWLETDGNKLQWLGHSAFRWQLGKTTLLSDPLLTGRASPFSFVGPKRYVPSPLKPVDAHANVILITHNHYDHLDINTLKALPNRQTVTVVVPAGVGKVIREEAGIANVVELDWNQQTELNGLPTPLKVRLVPAVHFSARWLNDRNQTLWGGYVVEAAVPQVRRYYLTGDTAYHPNLFKSIGAAYGPFDAALVPIGAYEPRSIMVASHTNPEEGVAIGQDTRAPLLVGHHWGAIVLTDEPQFEPAQRFHKAAAQAGYDEAHAWVMAVGETRHLP